MRKTYYHATDYKNMNFILKHGILKGRYGYVYLADTPERAATLCFIKGVKNIIVFAVDLDNSNVVGSFNYSQESFRCRIWMHKGTIIPEYLTRIIHYDTTKSK